MGSVGFVSLLLALIIAVFSIVSFAFGAKRKSPRFYLNARIGLMTVTGLVTLSVLILVYAIFSHNFQMEYVADYTSLHSSPLYLFSALWAGNSGSLLFWAWLLSIFSLVVMLRKRNSGRELLPYAGLVLMVTEAFFLILLIAVTNPFNQLKIIPPDGQGLNPMLQNLGMVFHPPALLAGYVGFTIPFAFAISALLKRKTGEEWLIISRRWMLLSWLLLGIGNIIGAWWAYVELGWGGYWAWDPVENAGLMPWLIATAFLHSSIIQRRKGIFRTWNMVLVILTFCFVIFGTFITRSGMLSSVHTFSDSGMTPYFTVFLAIAFFGSLLLLYSRLDDLKGEARTESLISRESSFLLNNILFVGSALIILVGTVFPAISEALRGAKLSLNSSFFSRLDSPLFMLIILLAGICTVIGWKQLSINNLLRNILWPSVASLAVVTFLFITGMRQPLALIAFFVCLLVVLLILKEWSKETAARHKPNGENYLTSWWNILRSNTQHYGGYIVHIGIVLIAFGVIGSSFYSDSKEATLKIGDSLTINQYTITYNGLTSTSTPDDNIVNAKLSVYNSGALIGTLVPQKIYHKKQEQPVTEVAIRSNLREDLYVILEGWEQNGSTADFKVLVNPLVSWIWIGGFVFLLGGLVAFWPARRSKPISVPEQGKQGSAIEPGKHHEIDIEDEIEQQVLQKRQEKQLVCAKCNFKNPRDSRFCSHCGSSLTGKDKKQ